MAAFTRRVLVVDDERFFREAIRDALAETGVPCELVANGAEARKAAEDPSIACVVLDVRLPDESGVEVLRSLRQTRPSVRVIVLSAHTDQELVLEALRLGACDYLAKPIHDEELRLAVSRALEGHAVESRWESLRARLQLLAARGTEFAAKSDAAEPEGFGTRVVEGLAEVLGASRTSLMWLSDDGKRLCVRATCGAHLATGELDAARVDDSVSGLAIREGHALLIDDIESDPRCQARARRPEYLSSAVALAPLDAGDGPFAVLCATDRPDGRAFQDEDLALLRTFAQQAAHALAPEPISLPPASAPAPSAPSANADVSGEDPKVELVRAVCDAMTREIDPARLLAAALRSVSQAIRSRVVSLYLIDNITGRLTLESQCERSATDRPTLPRDKGLTAGPLQSGVLIASDHPERDPRFDPAVDTPEEGGGGSLLVIPLRIRDKVLGVVRVFPEPGASAESRIGEVLGAALSAATRNVLLYRSLLDSVEDLARARRESEGARRP